MAKAQHTEQGARLRNASLGGKAEQSVDYMGSFQFNGFSFGVEGSSMAMRPADAPPLNSFMVWRGNKVSSTGGFSLGADYAGIPGSEAEAKQAATAQPCMSEVLMEGNKVEQSAYPFAKREGGITGLLLRANSFDDAQASLTEAH